MWGARIGRRTCRWANLYNDRLVPVDEADCGLLVVTHSAKPSVDSLGAATLAGR